MKTLSQCILGLVFLTCGCTGQQTGGALDRPDAPPSRLLTFAGTLQPRGLNSHPFTVTRAGEVQITLLGASLVGVESPPPLTVGLGIGTLTAGGACVVTHAVNTQGGARAQITGTGQEGTLCTSIYDVGNLSGPAIYTITVATP